MADKPETTRLIPYPLTLVFILIGLGLLLCGLTIAVMAIGILRPPRMTDGKAVARLHRLSPGDLGLAFVDHAFTIRDARTGSPLHIAGWWIPAIGSDRCAILLHGYADAKVGAIAWAPTLHQLGLNVLAIDLRGHGESGGADSTGGYFERDDVNEVIDQLLSARPAQATKLVIFGVSLGAAVAAATRRDDLAAVILESPFADYRRIVTAHTMALGLPAGWIVRAALAVAQRISGANFAAVRPIDTIGQLRCPLLMILGGRDELLDQADVTALQQAVQRRPASAGSSLVITAGNASHLTAIHTDPAGYTETIGAFLGRAFEQHDVETSRRA